MYHNPVDPLRGQLVVENDRNKNCALHQGVKSLADY